MTEETTKSKRRSPQYIALVDEGDGNFSRLNDEVLPSDSAVQKMISELDASEVDGKTLVSVRVASYIRPRVKTVTEIETERPSDL